MNHHEYLYFHVVTLGQEHVQHSHAHFQDYLILAFNAEKDSKSLKDWTKKHTASLGCILLLEKHLECQLRESYKMSRVVGPQGLD